MITDMPRMLIEDWLPIDRIGAESLRDASAARKPPLNRLHVWWARRPLTVSRAAIIGSLLPKWSPKWPPKLLEQFPNEEVYQTWYLHFLGIYGNPVNGRKLIQLANEKGQKIKGNPYGYPRAFTVNPSTDTLQILEDLLEYTWGTRRLSVLDPFAGGGSIPFEALRYGFTTIANDLNPVAAVILKATLEYPARFGPELAADIRMWGDVWAKRVEEKLASFFPKQPGETIFAYLWARTVACPTTGKPVPLSPNWWLSKEPDLVAVQLVADKNMDIPKFVIVKGEAAKVINPDEGTMSRGIGRSPWTGETISGDYIKAEAQVGRMGRMLYAIVTKRPDGETIFRVPTDEDLAAISDAEAQLQRKTSTWQTTGLWINESIPTGNKTSEPLRYGELYWNQAFSLRQFFALTTYLECLQDMRSEMRQSLDTQRRAAVETYLSLMLDKAVIYNNGHCRFDPGRGIRSVFDRHDFAFVWSHAEFDASTNLLPWAVNQIWDAYTELAKYLAPAQTSYLISADQSVSSISITRDSANSILSVADGSVHNITVDPPYYDNVQYAELSDFFYVWLKRSVGHLFPEFFTDELTNKDDEAVANPARFAALKHKKVQLAEQDYERKMAAAFREMHRVLHPQGVLTVMFTHKKVEAWDTLASALIGAGFTIKASWPIHTESEHSLHQAKKNAAASTIVLVCRKRPPLSPPQRGGSEGGEAVWWDDLQSQVRRVAREKAQEYAEQGIGGVDLYISTFGPTLSVISERWPVLTSEIDPQTGQPRPLRPETALDLAREEVVRLRREGLLAGKPIAFDPVTDWYLMAWDAFKAEQFPFDEARKLAIALGLELDYLQQTKRLIGKKGQYVILQQPAQRRKKGMVDPDVAVFEHWIDALHTAMMIYAEDGAGACDAFLMHAGLKRDATFRAGLQALLNAIPRAQVKGKFVRPEAEVLDRLRLAFYADELTIPPVEEPPLPHPHQLGIFAEEEEDEEDEEDDGA